MATDPPPPYAPALTALKTKDQRSPSWEQPRLSSLPAPPRVPLNLRLAARGAAGSGSSSQADPLGSQPFLCSPGSWAAHGSLSPGRFPWLSNGPSARGPPRLTVLLRKCPPTVAWTRTRPAAPGSPARAVLSPVTALVFPVGPFGWKQVFSGGGRVCSMKVFSSRRS